jgi:hypothetical protein
MLGKDRLRAGTDARLDRRRQLLELRATGKPAERVGLCRTKILLDARRPSWADVGGNCSWNPEWVRSLTHSPR